MDARSVISALGGYRAAGEALRVARSTLALWEQSGIPPARWTQVAVALAEAGQPTTLEDLAAGRPDKEAAA